MTLKEVYLGLEKVAAVSSRNEKILLLTGLLKDETFRRVCVAAYDPFITYGITPDLDRKGASTWGDPDLEQMFGYLDDLAARRLTGGTAKQCVEEMLLQSTPEAGALLVRILNKDLRAGFTATTLNKVVKGLVREYEPMAAHHFEEKRIKSWPVAAEPKLDGLRVEGWVDYLTGEAVIRSRNGNVLPALQPLADRLLELQAPFQKLVFEGEVATGEFNSTTGKARRKSETPAFAALYLFDAITPEEFVAGSKRTYEQRRAALHGMLLGIEDGPMSLRLMPQRILASTAEVIAYYNEMRAISVAEFLGVPVADDKPMEGIIVKTLHGAYEPKRSHHWLKVKAEETEDLEVVGAYEGEPSTKYAGMLGGVIVTRNGVSVRIGSGFSDLERKELWTNQNSLPGRLLEVEFHEVTPDGSLRHPRAVRWRDDKAKPAA